MTYLEMDRIAQKYGTDKSSIHHHYTRDYAPYFDQMRNLPITLLEFGVGGHEDRFIGGASLRLWEEYFPKATIIGVDIEPKFLSFKTDRVHVVQASQDDSTTLNRLAELYGPFDIVIDDASHVSSLTIAAFKAVYPHIKSCGLYVCEDTHMAYHDWYYGKNEANENPDLPTALGTETAMQFFRRMTDEVNFHGNYETDLFPEKYWRGYSLEWAHFYYNILFLKKAWWAK